VNRHSAAEHVLRLRFTVEDHNPVAHFGCMD
jgi:hypothetical protein